MYFSMRPLLHACGSGSILSTTAAGPTKRPFTPLSICTSSSRNGSLLVNEVAARPHRSPGSTNCASALESNPSTLAGTVVLNAAGHANGHTSVTYPSSASSSSGSTAGSHIHDPLLGWEPAQPPLAHAIDAAALRAADVLPSASQHVGLQPVLDVHVLPAIAVRPDVDTLGPSASDDKASVPRSALYTPPADADAARLPRDGADGEPQPVASTSAPSPVRATSKRARISRGRRRKTGSTPRVLPGNSAVPSPSGSRTTGGAASGPASPGLPTPGPPSSSVPAAEASKPTKAPSRGPVATGSRRAAATAAHTAPADLPRSSPYQSSSASTPSTTPTPRQRSWPRLNPPPAPLSWPDYPYTRTSAASACSLYNPASLKLEALFQCVLNYPRVPPSLLRFLNRATPGGVTAQLPLVTATVERLNAILGRELALYLIRRRPWVVKVDADAVGPRLEVLTRLLHVEPTEVPDLLRKNPNLLRLKHETLMERYQALHQTTAFNAEQIRALIIKYPLILNFHPDNVHSAAVALRRLCSARPFWAAQHAILSPSQFAFYMRERIQTLLRLEYLLVTGEGQSLRLREIMKTSNNSFRRSHTGFYPWMQERLHKLHVRLARARSLASVQTRDLPPEVRRGAVQEAVDVAKRVTWEEQQREWGERFRDRRESEERDAEHRAQQRRRALWVKEQLRQQQQQLGEASGTAAGRGRRQEGRGGQQRRLGEESGEESAGIEEDMEEEGAGFGRRSGAEAAWSADASGEWPYQRQRAMAAGGFGRGGPPPGVASLPGSSGGAGMAWISGRRTPQPAASRAAAAAGTSAAQPAASAGLQAELGRGGAEGVEARSGLRSGDPLAMVSAGKFWRRPGSKVSLDEHDLGSLE